MPTRLIFNGREYSSPEAMPADVRKAYQELLDLAFVAGFTIMFSVGLLFAIGGGRSHLAGRLTVAIAALLFLGWLDTQATRRARRREPILGPNTAGYRRFLVWSAVGLFGSAVLLLGLAWFLP